MAGYSIAKSTLSSEILQTYYTAAKAENNLTENTDLDIIFTVVVEQREFFPGLKVTGTKNEQNYINRWVKGYSDAMSNLPSNRIASPKSACTDPAIGIIVKGSQELSDEQIATGEKYHNLFMSAENIQGNLLEEYIAAKVRPYGFLWCAGNVLHAIDFCNTDGTVLLQIKNKSNTENSSSSTVREGTTIEKWFRVGTRTQRGVKIPVYKWGVLNEIINSHRTQGYDLPDCNMSETDYQAFLVRISTANHDLITNR